MSKVTVESVIAVSSGDKRCNGYFPDGYLEYIADTAKGKPIRIVIGDEMSTIGTVVQSWRDGDRVFARSEIDVEAEILDGVKEEDDDKICIVPEICPREWHVEDGKFVRDVELLGFRVLGKPMSSKLTAI